MGHDATWVVVVIFTKLAFFIPVKMTMSTDKLVEHYMYNIARLYSTPEAISSDRDARFTASQE